MHDLLVKQLSMIRGAWERRWVGVAVAWSVAVVGAVGISRVPDRFESTARVFVNTQSVLKPLIAGLTVQPDIDQQLNMLARTLISRPTIEKLIDDPRIGLKVPASSTRDGYIDDLAKAIKIGMSGRENLYNISYRDEDPQRAQRLVQTLVDLFVESGTGNKRADSDEARKFIDEQIKEYETKLTEAEGRLKDFKVKNFGFTGASNVDYFSRMNTASEDLDRLTIELRAAEQSRDSLRQQLANEQAAASAAMASADANLQTAVPELDQRIDAQKKQLDDLLRRFTEQHPDVASTRRVIAQLEKQKRDELAARAKATAAGQADSSNNPVMQRIKISLAEAEANVAGLRARVSDRQAKLAALRASAGKVPQVEADLAQLNRDYDVIRHNYDQLVARRESASIGIAVDATSQLAEFRIVEPPHLAPVMPNRLILVAMLMVAAVGVGAAVAYGVAVAFPTVHGVRALREIGGRPVLGSISMLVGEPILRHEKRMHALFAALLATLVIYHVVWLSWISIHSRI